MQPEISETKKDGLKKFYGIKDENTLKFFTVHMHADKWHREVVRNLIKEISNTKNNLKLKFDFDESDSFISLGLVNIKKITK